MVLRRTGVGLSENMYCGSSVKILVVIVKANLFGITEYYIITLGMIAWSIRYPYSKKILRAVLVSMEHTRFSS